MNLATLLSDSATKYPDRTAIVLGGTRLSYRQVEAASNQVANLLTTSGVGPADTVALTCPNLPYFAIAYYGILKTGAAVVPLNVLFKPREIAYHLADSNAKAYLAFEGTPELPMGAWAQEGFQDTASCTTLFSIRADPAAPLPWADQSPEFESVTTDDDDVAVILYTSGTTGRPKGAELRHRNMRDNALVGKELFHADEERPDTYLGVLPMFHSFGQTVIQNMSFAFGGTVVLLPRFDAKAALAVMAAEQVTFFAGVPTMYWALLAALDDTVDVDLLARNLRVAAAGGSALPVEIHRQFEQRFGVVILEGYGLSETSPIASFAVYGERPRVGSIGLPIPGVQMKLIEPDWADVPADPDTIGEIAIKGHNVMKGYHDNPGATEAAIQDGWFRSGDLGRKDTDGFYYIVDRSKDMIIRGGFNVYPREIEETMLTHPAVSLAAVIGVPDDENGEEIKAFVIRNAGDTTSAADLVAWCADQMAAYKFPRTVEFVDALPMTATGKILKRELPRG